MTVATLDPAEEALREEARDIVDRILRPTPDLSTSEWADEHRHLSREASAEPGRWKTERTPYLREPMDCLSDRRTQVVTLMFPSQSGKTEVVLNAVGRFAHIDPSPMLILQPSERPMAEAFSKDRLAPMIRDSPVLKEVFAPAKSRDSQNTILHKTFRGGHVTLVGANSASGLASRPIRFTAADEIDRYPVSAGQEGDPLALAEKRTTTFAHRKKKLRTSTPTELGLSRIHESYLEGDQRVWEWPCPECDEFQAPTWEQIRWTDNDPETAVLVCRFCGAAIPERKKPAMNRRGRWTATAPFRGHASFHLSGIASPFVRWSEAVREFLDAGKNPERLKVWVNTYLAEPWEDKGERVDGDALLHRRETYNAELPGGIAVLTASVDVQGDRLEVTVWGWGAGEECWLVRKEVLLGDPGLSEPWLSLEEVLAELYEHESGNKLRVRATAVDSGGHHTGQVYKWVKPRQGRRVWAIKGRGGEGTPLLGRPSRANKAGVKLLPVGVHGIKDTLFSRLRMKDPGPGYIHLPEWFTEEDALQLTAEKRVTKYSKGRPYREYEKLRPRNELLDLWVYGYAALLTLGPGVLNNLGTLVEKLWEDPEEEASSPKSSGRSRGPRRRSSWASRWRP